MTEPIPSATLILLRDTAHGIETLIMRRHKNIKFLGGFWVFPGGAVDAADIAENELATARKAAIRETREEAGVSIDEAHLLPVSRWITPEGAPKRFSTWFFIGRASDETVQVDGEEMTDSLWVSPQQAIASHRAQQIDMLPPTLVSLTGLQGFGSSNEVLDFYRQREPLFFLPKADFHGEQLVMLYPGDAGYALQEPANVSLQHRCVHLADGWHYINEAGVR